MNKPINLDALTAWADHIPDDVREDMEELAPMLRKMGYDPTAYPPNYGEADPEVLERSKKIAEEKSVLDSWKI